MKSGMARHHDHTRARPAKLDADFITDLALSAGMRYVNITTRHHDSFCLLKTGQTDFNSVNSPAKRDLVGKLAEACRTKDLGLCLYYSHGRDRRHPQSLTLEPFEVLVFKARPEVPAGN